MVLWLRTLAVMRLRGWVTSHLCHYSLISLVNGLRIKAYYEVGAVGRKKAGQTAVDASVASVLGKNQNASSSMHLLY